MPLQITAKVSRTTAYRCQRGSAAPVSFTNNAQNVTLSPELPEQGVSALTTESEQAQWSVESLLELFEVQADGPDRFTADTGLAGQDGRQVVEGTQVVAQAIVAVANRFQGKSVRSAHAVFARAITVGPPIELVLDVVNEGRSTATAIVSALQNGKRCVTRDGADRRPDGRRHPAPPAAARRSRAR